MYVQNLHFVPLIRVEVPAHQLSGELSFQTLPDWQENTFEFVWFSQTRQVLAKSRPVMLAAPADSCGTCGGNNSACAGCDGTPHSGLRLDDCGVCGGKNGCHDCAGVAWGLKLVDSCGNCHVPVLTCAHGARIRQECERHEDCPGSHCSTQWPKPTNSENDKAGWNACLDCFGVPNGKALLDACGECDGRDNSCLKGYTVELLMKEAGDEVCVGDEVMATWQTAEQVLEGHANAFVVSIAPVGSDDDSGPLALTGWAYLDNASFFAANHGMLGQSSLDDLDDKQATLVATSSRGTGSSGTVLFNRSSDKTQADGCKVGGGVSEGEPRDGEAAGARECLQMLEYLHPSAPGLYRLSMYFDGDPEHIAVSRPFRVLPARDECGVCGGDGRSCAGCDAVPYSALRYDSCGTCGGEDGTCTRAPRIGLLPYPSHAICQQQGETKLVFQTKSKIQKFLRAEWFAWV